MKILLFPHHLELGGSQVNALDFGALLRDHGHDVVVFATPGPAVGLLEQRGLPLIAAPRPRISPSPTVIRALARHLSTKQYDVVWAWEWPQCVNAYFGARYARRTPVAGTIMSMDVMSVVPRSIPVTYGTEELCQRARAHGYPRVRLLEPPVNLELDGDASVDGDAFRNDLQLRSDDVVITVVSRLVGWLKLEGLNAAIAAIDSLAFTHPVRLVIVGGGPEEANLRARASSINAHHGREVITLTGALEDPRQAYAGTDIVVGMGGSVLRGMAFGKPAVVLGERGFAEVFDEESSKDFLFRGMYGIGTGGYLADRLQALLPPLLDSSARRDELGRWSADVVRRRYSLAQVAYEVEHFLRAASSYDMARGRTKEILGLLSRRAAAPLQQSAGRLRSRLPLRQSEPAP